MNKYERYLLTCDLGYEPYGRLAVYLEPSDVKLGDAVWDTHYKQWTTVVGIDNDSSIMFFHYHWANGNGAGWGYMSSHHRPDGWDK